jgi:hypothetical protein
MQLEKLHKLVLSQVHDHQKVKWWKLWNSGVARKGEEGFPTGSVSDKDLEQFLHKATYWHHVHHYAFTFHPLLKDFHNLIRSLYVCTFS